MNHIAGSNSRRRFFLAPEHGGNVVKGGGHPDDSKVPLTEQIDDAFAQDERGRGKTPGVGVPGSQNNPLSPEAHERVTRRAHQIWEEEGCPDGRSEDHWLRAEQEERGGGA